MYEKHSYRIHDEFIRRSRKILGASSVINFVLSITLAVLERRKLFEQSSAIFPSKMPLMQHLLLADAILKPGFGRKGAKIKLKLFYRCSCAAQDDGVDISTRKILAKVCCRY
jgi:hypothetical protein